MDLNRVDLILKYCLACSGQKDPGERELGPIHLIKYVYLADLYYAERHQGKTFTGIPWQFYNFGPWSLEVFQRIEPVIRETGATERRYVSTKYDNDAIRYSLDDDEMFQSLEQQLSLDLAGRLALSIKSFGSDTSSLLHYVYATPPMLQAAPRDILDFTIVAGFEEEIPEEQRDTEVAKKPQLSKTQKKKLDAELQTRKERIKTRLSEKSHRKRVSPPTPPPYEEVFFRGLEWLDSLAGEPIEESQGELNVSPEIWNSRARWEQEP